MRFLELLPVAGSEKYIVHVEESIAAGELLEAIDSYLGCIEEGAEWVLYHVKSGRFLNKEVSIEKNGVESGDTLLLINAADGTNVAGKEAD